MTKNNFNSSPVRGRLHAGSILYYNCPVHVTHWLIKSAASVRLRGYDPCEDHMWRMKCVSVATTHTDCSTHTRQQTSVLQTRSRAVNHSPLSPSHPSSMYSSSSSSTAFYLSIALSVGISPSFRCLSSFIILSLICHTLAVSFTPSL